MHVALKKRPVETLNRDLRRRRDALIRSGILPQDLTHDVDPRLIKVYSFRCNSSSSDVAAMRYIITQFIWLFVCAGPLHVFGNPIQVPLTGSLLEANRNISDELFADLEELSRIVDISYCVGATGTGIQKPFLCASRCQDFPHFELVTVSTSRANHSTMTLTAVVVDMEHRSLPF